MSKLTAQDKFLDLSDYGRPFGKFLANQLKNTRFTPIHVTILFGISGLIAIYCILNQHYFWAGFFIILKSGIDAADGELARLKNTPSYVGRYLDSVFDIILNFLFLMTICYVSKTTIWFSLLAFIGIQLQGTLYNYYYVILRNKSVGGDATSKIFEYKSPKALPGETQKSVNILFKIYTIVYGVFDKIIHALDQDAYKVKTFPNWFMTLLSLYGLGFQLLIIAIMLPLGWIEYIVPFFIAYTLLIFGLIGIRKTFIH
ncbi:CDP-alcohol phosphatidyltransferase family protein [Flavobacterium aquatile]|uniref:CDP-alcohol phosphatidyltransferase n=1 Tax=Flavobacterium aquatile LMG 4008 = ATCC 11947 TaxID=1453498 RepID=A0A095SV17_9FLAO|nr:CDP-alcohol phosphatidyltransferase family protein [Flavobacterium aquatile]KGD68506.1 CDP-alcohol phosphatidyltransferase [Flavobacterium aquatile LMG 4008 = ATCC 11947]OXA68564.1 CDP-alcohol phosphatidyltransferase [Flavobacterium aquatile LMG 4008 = ATCC 11947]GEC79443.1 CDP-alcohol phosphatidyltransferase [Flavobacterium aquatile]